MAQLGDTRYRFPEVDEWTNLVFLLVMLSGLSFFEQLIVAPAALTVCAGSWLWHKREDVQSRRFDELGMMMLMSGIAAVGAARLFGLPPLLLLALPVWGFYYLKLHKTSSFRHIAYWSVPILAALVYSAGWWTLLPVGLVLFALYGQFGLPWADARYEHGPRHGLLWHIPVGLALLSVLYLTGMP